MRPNDGYIAAAEQVLLSGRYILGQEVEAFEKEAAAWLGAPFALGVSSGTDALLLALMALGVRPGDQVICPSYTFFATAGVIDRLGARPVFVDSCPACMTLDVQQLQDAITPLTRAIVPVHLFGHGANMAGVMTVAQSHGISVVEDVAQAMGTQVLHQAAGTVGHAGCMSFFPSKNMGGFGDGGLVLCQDASVHARAASLRVHGSGEPRYLHHHVGGNFRLDALQAALLRQRLPQASELLRRRASHGALYHDRLLASGKATTRLCSCAAGISQGARTGWFAAQMDTPIALPNFAAGDTVNQYVITLANKALRQHLQQQLQQQNISTSIYYPLPLHLQPCFAHLGYRLGDMPVAEHLSQTSLALPIAPELTSDEITQVSAAVLRGIDSWMARQSPL